MNKKAVSLMASVITVALLLTLFSSVEGEGGGLDTGPPDPAPLSLPTDQLIRLTRPAGAPLDLPPAGEARPAYGGPDSWCPTSRELIRNLESRERLFRMRDLARARGSVPGGDDPRSRPGLSAYSKRRAFIGSTREARAAGM